MNRRTIVLVAVAGVAALGTGAVVAAKRSAPPTESNTGALLPAPPTDETTAAATDPAVAIPVAATEPTVVRERIVYRDRVVPRTTPRRSRYYVKHRSHKRSAAIIGGSAIGGAGIGALVGGRRGALIGGVVGGAGGTVYDRKTHRRVVRRN